MLPDGAESTRQAELWARVVWLQAEIARLRRELPELRQQVGYWHAMHRRATE